jgi:hypothetical protein
MKIVVSALVFLIIGTLFSVGSLMIEIMPSTETTASWFQRSGSILVIFAIAADALLAAKYSTFYPGDNTVVIGEPGKIVKLTYVVVSVIAVIFTVAGTLIWGYGDLFV